MKGAVTVYLCRGLKSLFIIISVLLLFQGYGWGEVIVNDNVKVSGAGNGIIFPDGTSQTTGRLKVYDANGSYLGELHYITIGTSILTVYIPAIKKFMWVDMNTGDATQPGFDFIHFMSADCTGQPFIERNTNMFIIRNQGRYYTGPNIPPQPITRQSSLESDGRCHAWSASTIFAVPAIDVTGQLPFVLPAAAPLTVE